MKTIKIKDFGRDHWSTLAYIECRCVDHQGQPDLQHMRCNSRRHPFYTSIRTDMAVRKWKPSWSTRLKSHTLEAIRQVKGHDDWDCANDLEKAGLIEIRGSGLHPIFKMTKLGNSLCAKLREHKNAGGSFSTFELCQD